MPLLFSGENDSRVPFSTCFSWMAAEGGLIDCGSGFEIFDEIKKGIRRPVCLSYPLPSGPYFGGVSF
ncbi:S9 family peptidase, partial [Roseburia faecis]|nr:S9 family peptidase [Roseburia faecis]